MMLALLASIQILALQSKPVTTSPLKVTLALAPRRALDTKMMVVVTISNVSNRPQYVYEPAGQGRGLYFTAQAFAGSSAPNTTQDCPPRMSEPFIELDPGESVVRKMAWLWVFTKATGKKRHFWMSCTYSVSDALYAKNHHVEVTEARSNKIEVRCEGSDVWQVMKPSRASRRTECKRWRCLSLMTRR